MARALRRSRATHSTFNMGSVMTGLRRCCDCQKQRQGFLLRVHRVTDRSLNPSHQNGMIDAGPVSITASDNVADAQSSPARHNRSKTRESSQVQLRWISGAIAVWMLCEAMHGGRTTSSTRFQA
jgi:hypothetical protein